MFWWFNYMENSIGYDDVVSINREFKDLNDAIAFAGFSPFNINPINTEKHTKDYELGDVSVFNNLGKDVENKINVKKDG